MNTKLIQTSGAITPDPVIRAAKRGEAAILSKISLAAKKYWGYPEEYFKIWESELLVTSQYIDANTVFASVKEGEIAGYYSVVEITEETDLSGITLSKGHWLDHMFVKPAFIGLGLGSRMFTHLCQWCRKRNIAKIRILADPHARGFYEKMGCEYQREYPSTIPGRTTPLLVMQTIGCQCL